MGSRITNNILYRTALSHVSQQRLRLARTQEQAASGLRINHLADDPVGVRAATLLKAGLEATAQFSRNITRAQVRVREVDAALADTNELLIRARELAQQGANGTLGPDERRSLAAEVETLHARLLANANARAGGGYVFSGYTGDVAPFRQVGSFGASAPPVLFDGDANEVQVEIDERARVPVTLDGRRVFQGDADGDGAVDAGRVDLFQVIGDLRDALFDDDVVAIRGSLDAIDLGLAQVGLERTGMGAVDTQLERFDERLALREADLTQRLSDAQDADSVEVFSNLVTQEAALRASLEATSRLIQPTLLDFLS